MAACLCFPQCPGGLVGLPRGTARRDRGYHGLSLLLPLLPRKLRAAAGFMLAFAFYPRL